MPALKLPSALPSVTYVNRIAASQKRAIWGFKSVNGAYVVFLDADDRLKPEAIESGLRAMELHPGCAFAVGDLVFISGDGSYLSPSRKVANLPLTLRSAAEE
jgi:cellulose synthase/poly-beta-1,6-N-acetylglucosamine synthase-like glycosyltransferase